MGSIRRVCVAALIAAPVFVAACRKDSSAIKVDSKDMNFAARDPNLILGPNDIRVVSGDSGVEVALIGDSLVAGLGPRARAKIKESTDTMTVASTGFAGTIERAVKGAVAGALDHELHFPLTGVSDVRYEGGNLRFYDAQGKPMLVFEHKQKDGLESSLVFRPADAQAFIAAFKKRKSRPV